MRDHSGLPQTPRGCCRVESKRGLDLKNPNSQNQDPIFTNYKLPDHQVRLSSGWHSGHPAAAACQLMGGMADQDTVLSAARLPGRHL